MLQARVQGTANPPAENAATWLVTAAVVALALVTGCGPRMDTLPPGVEVALYQTRSDVPLGRLEIQVRNDRDEPLVVTRATLDSPMFVAPVAYDRQVTIPARTITDLKLTLPAASCADVAQPAGTVTLQYRTADGGSATGSVVPGDPIGQLADLTTDECLRAEVARSATIAVDGPLVTHPGRAPAQLRFTVTPTGADGTLRLRAALPTVLFALVDEHSHVVESLPLDLVVTADSRVRTFAVRIVPSRCDAHALAEDKRGTYFPFTVTTAGGSSGRVTLGVDSQLRGQLYTFFGRYCGLS